MVDPVRDVREGIERLQAVREAVGPDFRICIDLHGIPTPPMAVEFCTAAGPYHPYFVEEATQIEDLDELAHLRSKTPIPLATGERLFTKYGFSERDIRRNDRRCSRLTRSRRRGAVRKHLAFGYGLNKAAATAYADCSKLKWRCPSND